MFIFGSEYARELLQNSQNISSLILVVASRRTKMSKILIYFCVLVAILAFECNAGHAPHAPHYADYRYPNSRMRRIHLKWMTVSLFSTLLITLCSCIHMLYFVFLAKDDDSNCQSIRIGKNESGRKWHEHHGRS